MASATTTISGSRNNSISTDTVAGNGDGRSGIQAIPFAVQLSSSTLRDDNLDGPSSSPPLMAGSNDATGVAMMGDHGIVGSIVLMGSKSAMIYVGWGHLQLLTTATTMSAAAAAVTADSTAAAAAAAASKQGFGKGAPTMGPIIVAMPRTHYKGAFGTGANEPSCSQLIGSASSEDQMLATQMASRLSARLNMAIFVSCQLSSSNGAGMGPDKSTSSSGEGDLSWTAGLNSDMISHKAAALAEREIWKILQEQQRQK